MVDELTSFIDMMAELDLDAYLLPKPHGETVRALRRVRELAHNIPELIEEICNLQQPDTVRVFAVGQMISGEINEKQVEELGEFLLKDRSLSVQLAIAKLFQHSTQKKSVNLLIEVLVTSQDLHLRGISAESLRNNKAETWEQKIVNLLSYLQISGRFREHLDIAALVTAVTPPAETTQSQVDRHDVADTILASCPIYLGDPRMVGILAALLIECCGHNLRRAMQHIDRYLSAHEDNRDKFSPLRYEINSLLTPVEWHETLNTTYHMPLEELQKDVRKKWLSSVFSAQVGLWVRLGISILVATGGIILLGMGVYNLSDNDLWPQSFIQIALALILLLISLVHQGPVRDTQQTLAEIGVASTVYATFSQQRINISNQHSALIMQNRLTTSDIKESSQLLGLAMREAVQTLRNEQHTISLDDFLAQFD